jgi:hypothetical protein
MSHKPHFNSEKYFLNQEEKELWYIDVEDRMKLLEDLARKTGENPNFISSMSKEQKKEFYKKISDFNYYEKHSNDFGEEYTLSMIRLILFFKNILNRPFNGEVQQGSLVNLEHCCERMESSVDRGSDISPWHYNERYRTYSVQSVNHPGAEIVDYCPFCGSKLPVPLNDEWRRILKEDYKLNDPISAVRNNKKLAEFRTDEWWKKRGL